MRCRCSNSSRLHGAESKLEAATLSQCNHLTNWHTGEELHRSIREIQHGPSCCRLLTAPSTLPHVLAGGSLGSTTINFAIKQTQRPKRPRDARTSLGIRDPGLAQHAAAIFTGDTPGLATGVVGGGDAVPVYPEDIGELKAYLKDKVPRAPHLRSFTQVRRLDCFGDQ